jgi:hypothetical protein
MDPKQIGQELAEASVVWKKTKDVYLALGDSKAASPDEVEAARRAHLQAVKRLDKAVTVLMKLPLSLRRAKRPKKPIPWKGLLDSTAVALATLSRATDEPRHPLIDVRPIDQSKVIDVQVEND